MRLYFPKPRHKPAPAAGSAKRSCRRQKKSALGGESRPSDGGGRNKGGGSGGAVKAIRDLRWPKRS